MVEGAIVIGVFLTILLGMLDLALATGSIFILIVNEDRVVFGCLDISRAVRHYMVISNAVRVGTEYGATQRFTPYTKSAWEQRVRDVVNEELQEISGDPTLSSFTIKIKIDPVDNAIDTELSMVRVEVQVYFTPTFNWPGLPTTIHIKHHVHLRQFR